MFIRIQHKVTGKKRLAGDLAFVYCAGMVDGEGCIHLAKATHKDSRRGYTYRLRLTIAQNHLHTLTDFQDLIGVSGLLYQNVRHEGENRDSYQLVFDGIKAVQVIEIIQPYLLRKAPEAKVALNYQRTCQPTRHFGRLGCPQHVWEMRDAHYTKLQRLK